VAAIEEENALMARLGRYFLPDQPLHLIQRGNNREPVFFADEDYCFYLQSLGEAAGRAGVRLHAYVLMTNHVHLLVTPAEENAIPDLMQVLGTRYVRRVNQVYRRTGTLWEGRYRAAPIEAEAHLISCMRYIELNPVRARMCEEAGDYPWSSYRGHAGGAVDPLLSDHGLYLALGATTDSRAEAYRSLFHDALSEDFVADLRDATNGGWALGSDKFKEKVATMARRRSSPSAPGRPPNTLDSDERQGELL
jgi:putative transposase